MRQKKLSSAWRFGLRLVPYMADQLGLEPILQGNETF